MNPNSPIFPLVQRVKGRLEALYGERLAGLYLYGSHARGEATDDSDIDLLVALHGRVDTWTEGRRLVRELFDLELEAEELISAHPVSADRFELAETPLLRNARREGVAVCAPMPLVAPDAHLKQRMRSSNKCSTRTPTKPTDQPSPKSNLAKPSISPFSSSNMWQNC